MSDNPFKFPRSPRFPSPSVDSKGTSDRLFSPIEPSSRTTTPTTIDEQRWSQVVPPKSALTFAAVWDDEKGMVTFSGAKLLERTPSTSTNTLDSPTDAYDNRSQVLTIDRLMVPGVTMGVRDTFGDMDSYFGGCSYLRTAPTPTPKTPTMRMPRHKASTTNGFGVDVYVRSSGISRSLANWSENGQRDWRQLSCLRILDGDIDFDPRTAFEAGALGAAVRNKELYDRRAHVRSDDVTDEGYWEPPQRKKPVRAALHLVSRFSTTTTSTSDYVEVELDSSLRDPISPPAAPVIADDDSDSTTWSTMENPGHCGARKTPRSRRLKKGRQNQPAEPSEVLARDSYNHVVEPRRAPLPPRRSNTEPRSRPRISTPVLARANTAPSHTHCRRTSISQGFAGFARKFGSVTLPKPKLPACKDKAGQEETWICVDVTQQVEVTQKITQRVL
ncbi:hypothetical protein PLICRDRAFT_173265 [Plicaturopsis crispa FD-325 SS-3]|nr:hypothetical protein PLICRDRAFT_173265 [Plicaturopsis crispa FD-325 SS-3]